MPRTRRSERVTHPSSGGEGAPTKLGGHAAGGSALLILAPVPSRRDLERNYSEQVVNLIIGLAGGEPEVRGWWLTATDYREAEFEVL